MGGDQPLRSRSTPVTVRCGPQPRSGRGRRQAEVFRTEGPGGQLGPAEVEVV